MSFKKVERAIEFLERIGLTEIDIEVYTLLLDSPPLSIGEIQQSLGRIEFLEIGASIRDMQDIGLVKATKGDYHRYFAVLPFLREAVTVERETIFALNSLVTSIKEKKYEVDKKLEEIEVIGLPSYTSSLLSSFTDQFHSPVAKNIQAIREATTDTAIKAHRIFENKKESILSILGGIDNELSDLLKSSEERFSRTSSGEFDSMVKIIEKQKSENESALSKGHKEISAKMISLKKAIDSIKKSMEKTADKLGEEISKLSQKSEQLKAKEMELEEGIASMDALKQDLLSTLITARENLASKVHEGTPESPAAGPTRDEIKAEFSTLMESVKGKTADSMQSLLDSVKELREGLDMEILEKKNAINSLGEEVKSILESTEESITKIGKAVSDTLSRLHVDFVSGLEETSSELSSKSAKISEHVSALHSEVQNSVEKVKKASLDDVGGFFEELSELVTTTFKSPEELIKALEKTLVSISEDQVDKFVESNTHLVKTLMDQIRESEDFNTGLLYERINFAKTMLEGRGADLRAILRMSESFDVKRPIDTGIVLGLPAIYSTLSDFVLRTKRMVTVVTPKFDEGIFNVAISMRGKFRTTIVTKFNPKKKDAIIKKAKDIGTISLIEYEGEDILACFRDKEEIVFGYIVKGEDWTAVRSSQDSMISLFEDRLNEVVIRRSKKLV